MYCPFNFTVLQVPVAVPVSGHVLYYLAAQQRLWQLRGWSVCSMLPQCDTALRARSCAQTAPFPYAAQPIGPEI